MFGLKPSLLLPSDKTQYPECPVWFYLSPAIFILWLDQAQKNLENSFSSYVKQNTTYSASLGAWMKIMECTRNAQRRAWDSHHQVWTPLNFSAGRWGKYAFNSDPFGRCLGSRCLYLWPGQALGRHVETIKPHTLPWGCQTSATSNWASSTNLLSLFTLLLLLLHYH